MNYSDQNRIDYIKKNWFDLDDNTNLKLGWFRITMAGFILVFTGYIICDGIESMWEYFQNGRKFQKANIINGIYLVVFMDFIPLIILKDHIDILNRKGITDSRLNFITDLRFCRGLFSVLYSVLIFIVLFGIGLKYGKNKAGAINQAYAMAFWIGLLLILFILFISICFLHFRCKRFEKEMNVTQ